jgi:hypothetical protein
MDTSLRRPASSGFLLREPRKDLAAPIQDAAPNTKTDWADADVAPITHRGNRCSCDCCDLFSGQVVIVHAFHAGSHVLRLAHADQAGRRSVKAAFATSP